MGKEMWFKSLADLKEIKPAEKKIRSTSKRCPTITSTSKKTETIPPEVIMEVLGAEKITDENKDLVGDSED